MESNITGVQSGNGLSIVQIATSDQDTFDYISSGKALRDNLLHVSEVSDAGSVNTIFVINESDAFVFMMDGDILAGAKQNRVVNTSILLPPRSKTSIPVSCVERGRWGNGRSNFRGTDYSAPSSLRAAKASQVSDNLRERNMFASDQRSIWSRVDSYQASFCMASSTDNISDIFDGKADEFNRLVGHFTADAGANGMAVFIGKWFAGIDIFNRKEVYGEYFPKLLKGAAFETSARPKSGSPLPEQEARYRTLEQLDQIERAELDERPGVGVGIDRRFNLPQLTGFQLAYDGNIIHIAAFAGRQV